MTEPERVGSTWVLTRARDFEITMHTFVRGARGLTRTGFTSQILDLHTDRPHRLIVSAPERRGNLYPLHAGDEVEYFFQIDGVGYAFASVVQERMPYPLNDVKDLPAMRLSYPEHVVKIQRRAYYRATAPVDPPLPVKLRERPVDETEEDRLFDMEFPYAGQIHDISGAGIAVLTADPALLEPKINTELTVAFRLGADEPGEIVLDTRVRGITEPQDGEGRLLHLAWVDLAENSEATGQFAARIFKFVAERQRELLHERHERLRRKR